MRKRFAGYWSEFPEDEPTLTLGGYTTVLARRTDAPHWFDVVPRDKRDLYLQTPAVETIDQWLDRARSIYRERAAVEKSERPYLRSAYFRSHCEWFVDVQVIGKRPAEVAERAHTDRTGVERET